MSNFRGSYLIYVFRKMQKRNSEMQKFKIKHKLDEEFLTDLNLAFCGLTDVHLNSEEKICEKYGRYGWCDKPDDCKNSHNIDVILSKEETGHKANGNAKSDEIRQENEKFAN